LLCEGLRKRAFHAPAPRPRREAGGAGQDPLGPGGGVSELPAVVATFDC